MPTRNLGQTGHRVGIFSLGGQAVVETSDRDTAEAIVNKAIDLGVNYIDTASSYGGGKSEQNIGRVIKRRRGEVYLATKTHDRSYDGSMRLLETSLKRLQTDHLDCWQLHNVQTKEHTDRIFAKDGAIKALSVHPCRSHQSLSVRHASDGVQRRRQASVQFHRPSVACGVGKENGNHRHEDCDARANAVDLDASATGRTAETHGHDEAGCDHHEGISVLQFLGAGQHQHRRL
ncbi:MAG: aldo/keto reductase [Planctomycetota bacterium]